MGKILAFIVLLTFFIGSASSKTMALQTLGSGMIFNVGHGAGHHEDGDDEDDDHHDDDHH